MEAYCVKCKAKRTIQEAGATFTKLAQPATRGVCGECGTGLYRMGRTPAHEGLNPPEPVPKEHRKKGAHRKRKGKLVIVESPAKAQSIGRFLGKGYKLKASVGHVRDLLKSRMAVDVENNFEPVFRVPNDKREIVKELKRDVSRAEHVYLATDLDREGEAIAWHLSEALEIEPEQLRRVTFHEITRDAIEHAFSHHREINMRLVEAQQTRRLLDRLAGFSLSELLWKKVVGRLGAGRVQSVAVRFIVERERDIERHVPEEFWRVSAELTPENLSTSDKYFVARLHRVGEKLVGRDKEYPLGDESSVKPLVSDLEGASWQVYSVTRGQRRRKPLAPFRTSTLQQEASRRLRFTAQRTMAIAQQLYQGDSLDGDNMGGLITYMRTDSVQVSPQAQEQAQTYICEQYGEDYLPVNPPSYPKGRGSQEAHEAIRPTLVGRTPDALQDSLSRDQHRLYQLIWRRFVGSQMSEAIYQTLRVDVRAVGEQHNYDFRANGDQIEFLGFLRVYEPAASEDDRGDKESQDIPDLEEKDTLLLRNIIPKQNFTKPPPRFTEASLIKVLEAKGIGRPSTYAPTLSTIGKHGYVRREDRRLTPTEIGMTVNDLLVEFFPDVLDVGFTARMERDLDRIAAGDCGRVTILRDFWDPFSMDLERAHSEAPTIDKTPEPAGKDCPLCGKALLIKSGKFGKFIACSGFPECRHTETILEKIGVPCPECSADLVRRRSKKNRTFYGCSNYPDCKWTEFSRPLSTVCKTCGSLLLAKGKNKATCTACEAVWSMEELSTDREGRAGVETALSQ